MAQKEFRVLKVILTEKRLKTYADTMSGALERLAKLEADKASVASDFKAKIETADAEAREAGRVYRQGYVMESVSVSTILDFEGRKALVKRDDTGEIIEERPLTERESQMEITLTERAVNNAADEPDPSFS